MAQQVDVLICGSGSAGLAAATWLARTGIRCKILERRDGPMQLGQADGVQCRTVEVFESFGISGELLRAGYHVLEVAFWSSDASGNLIRTSRTADSIPGLSHQPHLILNQACINSFLLDAMRKFNRQEVSYGYTVDDIRIDSPSSADKNAYPVQVAATKDGIQEIFNAKYVLGCDGAHSTIRKSLGYKMIGDSTDAIWGVMDIYPRTDFPDIRKKATLRSNYGNLLLIPREGGSLVRVYIELPHGTVAKNVTLKDLCSTAQQIFRPFTLDIAETFWWSAYSIGQRLADYFSKENRIFLTGDACHTHSPKAGQGMNVSLQDGYNIGWKLAAVLKDQASSDLLRTYNLEREKVAADLIDFDRSFSKLFSMKADHTNGTTQKYFSEQFIKSREYTAGLTAKYDDSIITSAKHSKQEVAKNLRIGMRFPSSRVIRFCDAKEMQFAQALVADGRWRIVVFAGDLNNPVSAARLKTLAKFLSSDIGPAKRFTLPEMDIDSFVEPILVLGGERARIEQEQIPSYFWPETGEWRMRDLHKTYIDDEGYYSDHGKAYEKYGINPEEGAAVIVRPDQYISLVTTLDDHQVIEKFFDGFAIRQNKLPNIYIPFTG